MPATERKDLLVVPAWCDPRMRKIVWDAGSIHVGILAIDGQSLAYATDEGLFFSAKLSAIETHWPRFLHLIRGCDLRIAKRGYRLYFARPLPGARRIRETQATGITDALTGEYSKLASIIGGTAGQILTLGSMIGDLVAMPGEFSDQRIGQRNGDAVRARLEGR